MGTGSGGGGRHEVPSSCDLTRSSDELLVAATNLVALHHSLEPPTSPTPSRFVRLQQRAEALRHVAVGTRVRVQ